MPDALCCALAVGIESGHELDEARRAMARLKFHPRSRLRLALERQDDAVISGVRDALGRLVELLRGSSR